MTTFITIEDVTDINVTHKVVLLVMMATLGSFMRCM